MAAKDGLQKRFGRPQAAEHGSGFALPAQAAFVYRFLNLSTRPPTSAIFCLPV
jgi:hypothetical protein